MRQVRVDQRIDGMRKKMMVTRAERERPRKDDKVLADWNGLMISAFARGYQTLGDEKYRNAAGRAADFVLGEMTKGDRLQHSYRAGRTRVNAMLDDYAFLSQGLLDLYESTFDAKRIEQTESLADSMIEMLWDEERGGFYDTAAGMDDVLVRGKSTFDGAVPAGNAVAVHVLLRLSALTDKKGYAEKAERAMHLFKVSVGQYPAGFARLLNAYDFHRGPVKEIVVVGGRNETSTREMLATVYGTYLPNRVLAWTNPAAEDVKKLVKLIPSLEHKDRIEGRPAAYVCHGKVCYPPVTTPSDLKKRLAEK